MKTKSYCAKILLFGEYAVLSGSKGLAMPLQSYSGHLRYQSKEKDKRALSLEGAIEFISHSAVLRDALDVEKLRHDLAQGLMFESDIVPGTGMGSSGALCAAIYDTYARKKNKSGVYRQEDIPRLMDHMSLMESYYHGSSSGLDPLVSLVCRPVLVKSRKSVEFVSIDRSALKNLNLLQVSSQRKTSLLVQRFLQTCENEDYKEKVENFKSLTELAIERVLANDASGLEKAFSDISLWQYENMGEMICDEVRPLWRKGLETQEFFLKLCGAGGGGHYIVYKKASAGENSKELKNLKKLFL